MSKVLVLNASYEPLNICTWRRAVVLLMKGKAEQIEHNGKLVYADFPLPTVIRLRSYVKIPYKEISLSRRNLLHRDNYTCQYCGDRRHDLTIDHIIPRSRGGTDSWDNVVAVPPKKRTWRFIWCRAVRRATFTLRFRSTQSRANLAGRNT